MNMSVPCRYVHTPTALLNLDDYAQVLRLSQAVLNAVTPETLQRDLDLMLAAALFFCCILFLGCSLFSG